MENGIQAWTTANRSGSQGRIQDVFESSPLIMAAAMLPADIRARARIMHFNDHSSYGVYYM
jgi:hypothetical protein